MPGLAVRQYGSKFYVLMCYSEILSKLDYGIPLEAIISRLYC